MSTRMPWILGDTREVGERQRETVRETVDSNPRCSPVTLTALPLPEPFSPGDIAFVCWGQQFSHTSTWASALLALRVSKSSRWSGISPQDRAGVTTGLRQKCLSHTLFVFMIKYRIRQIYNWVCMWAHQHRYCMYWLSTHWHAFCSCVTLNLNWSDSWHWFILFIMPQINLTLHPCHSQNSFTLRGLTWKQ